jgi:hypothetical protein
MVARIGEGAVGDVPATRADRVGRRSDRLEAHPRVTRRMMACNFVALPIVLVAL